MDVEVQEEYDRAEANHYWEVRCPECKATEYGRATGFREAWAEMDAWKSRHIAEAHGRRTKLASEYKWIERVMWPEAADFDFYLSEREAIGR